MERMLIVLIVYVYVCIKRLEKPYVAVEWIVSNVVGLFSRG